MSVVVEHKVQSSDDDEDSSLETDDIESTNDEERDHEVHNNVMTAKGSEALQKYQEEMEQRFTCPLTLDFMIFPIKAGDNQTYERYAILQWFFEHQTSPLTREPLDISLFRPEKELQLEIRTYLTTHNMEIPVLPNTGYELWNRLIILRHMINYSSQNARYRHNIRDIESDISNIISNESQMEPIRYQERNNNRNASSREETNGRSTRRQTSLRTRRDRRYPIERASNNSDRDMDAGVDLGVSVDEGRGSRRDSRYRHAVYCERCRQDVFVLSFREYPFQTCRCGTLLTRIPPPNSSMGGKRSSCIIS